MLTIVTWLWGTKYGAQDVLKLQAGLRRHLKEPHRFLCLTERGRKIKAPGVEFRPIADPGLTKVPGCFVRLRMFDPDWQHAQQITDGVEDRLVCIDLDVVITGRLDPVFDRPEPFVVLQGANSINPCPFNGSLVMLRPGAHPELWRDFSLEAVAQIRHHLFPDDQAWFWHKLPDAAGWVAGQDGVYAFQKPGWPAGTKLPPDARIVMFPGYRSPSRYLHLGWVQDNWRV
jgi:hypothetical protein